MRLKSATSLFLLFTDNTAKPQCMSNCLILFYNVFSYKSPCLKTVNLGMYASRLYLCNNIDLVRIFAELLSLKFILTLLRPTESISLILFFNSECILEIVSLTLMLFNLRLKSFHLLST